MLTPLLHHPVVSVLHKTLALYTYTQEREREQKTDMTFISALHKTDMIVPIGTIISHEVNQIILRRTLYNQNEG